MLWGSGSTLLSTGYSEEHQPEATRVNSRYETNTGFSYCGNLNLSPGENDVFFFLVNSSYGTERGAFLAFLPVFVFICGQALRTHFPRGANFCSAARNSNELDLLFQANEHTWKQQAAVINQAV